MAEASAPTDFSGGVLTERGHKSFERATDAWKAHEAFVKLIPDSAAAAGWLNSWFDECEDVLADWRRNEPPDGKV